MDASTTLTVATYALIGVLVTAGVALVVGIATNIYNFMNLSRQKGEWTKDKKEKAYVECLGLLSSVTIPIFSADQDGNSYIDDGDFPKLVIPLRQIIAWMTIVAAYSPGISCQQIEQARNNLRNLLNKVQVSESTHVTETCELGTRHTTGTLDHGLSAAVDKAFEVVSECSKRELLRG